MGPHQAFALFSSAAGRNGMRSAPRCVSKRMATARISSDLRRWANLTVVQRPQEAKLPQMKFLGDGA